MVTREELAALGVVPGAGIRFTKQGGGKAWGVVYAIETYRIVLYVAGTLGDDEPVPARFRGIYTKRFNASCEFIHAALTGGRYNTYYDTIEVVKRGWRCPKSDAPFTDKQSPL